MKKILALLLVLAACSSVKTRCIIYDVNDKTPIFDSIQLSGTKISLFKEDIITLDDGTKDTVSFAILSRDGEITGSVQVREKDSISNVIIIDKIRKK